MPRFLIIQTAFIGDVVLSTPVIERLRESFPQAEIDILVRKGNESLLHEHPHINRVLIWNKKKQKHFNLIRLIFQVRKSRYDAVFNLQRFASTGLITMFSGAPYTSGFDSNPLSWSFSHKAHHQLGKKGETVFTHEVDRNISVLAGITRTDSPLMRLYPQKEHQSRAAAYASVPFITVSPASVWFTKELPAEQWIGFITRVLDKRVYLLGGPTDREKCENIRLACEGKSDVVNLAGELSFLESAALMSMADMNYTNDSGPLHFASAVDAPVAAVFCSTIPEFGFGPRSKNGHVIQHSEPLSCKPCGIHGRTACPEGHFSCGKIEPDQLLRILR